jgi:hypothetical protein
MALKCTGRRGGASMNGVTPGGKTDRSSKSKTIIGENTGKVKTDAKGRKYSLIMETTDKVFKGDTIFPGNLKLQNGYIPGGDYNVKETKSSKKRATDEPRSFKIQGASMNGVPTMKGNKKDKVKKSTKKQVYDVMGDPYKRTDKKRKINKNTYIDYAMEYGYTPTEKEVKAYKKEVRKGKR